MLRGLIESLSSILCVMSALEFCSMSVVMKFETSSLCRAVGDERLGVCLLVVSTLN